MLAHLIPGDGVGVPCGERHKRVCGKSTHPSMPRPGGAFHLSMCFIDKAMAGGGIGNAE